MFLFPIPGVQNVLSGKFLESDSKHPNSEIHNPFNEASLGEGWIVEFSPLETKTYLQVAPTLKQSLQTGKVTFTYALYRNALLEPCACKYS